MNFESAQTILFSTVLVLCLLIATAIPVKALNMSNSWYIIQMGDLNAGAGKSTGSGYKLNQTLGQTGPGLYSGTNYKIRAGFQYISSIVRFRFTISNIDINFGLLTATNPVTRTNTLTMTNGSAAGYSVTAMENHQLLNPANGQMIPNTTCDNGLCTATTSDAWTNTLTYGFGYRCDNISGTDCASGFASANNYKQFSASPSATAVMSSSNVGTNRQVQITYKINISGSQPAGLYSNIITYIATPTF